MGKVAHVENADGSHSLGVEVDKVFVPFVTVPAERFAQQRAQAEYDAEHNEDTTTEGEA